MDPGGISERDVGYPERLSRTAGLRGSEEGSRESTALDLGLLRDVLARDMALAPESARAPIEEAIIQLDLGLAWTLGGKAAMPLAGLAACHSYRVTDPDERLLAAAAAIALSAAGSPGHHGFPRHGVLPPPASSSSDVALGFVSTMGGLLKAFADRHLKAFASSAAVLAADETERTRIVTDEMKAVLRGGLWR